MPDVVVVGAALVRAGRLLAARRSAPAEVAGGWELPGGKVEPGEDERAALARECREELGIEVEAGERVGPEVPLKPGYVLRVWTASCAAGEPVPLEDHDALRWLVPEELDEVPWLAADRPAVAAVRGRLLDGDPLAGARTGAVVRVGSTVRRPAGPWTPAVHALLAHLRAAGVPGVPRALGLDERGREVLELMSGEPPGEPAEPGGDRPAGPALLADLGGWLRRAHDASRDYAGPSRWRRGELPLPRGHVVCHNDPGPYNCLLAGGRLVGVVDWDMAAPGRPVEDLAFAAWMWVLRHGVRAGAGDPRPAAREVAALADAYGMAPTAVLAAVEPRLRGAAAWIRRGAAAGDPGLARLVAAGVPGQVERDLLAWRVRRPAVLAALPTSRG